jgi:sporulation protein YlmC with PRC-barrel domain
MLRGCMKEDAMRIDLHAAVRTSDGHGAGHIKSAVWDPAKNELAEFVIATGGLLGRDVLISREVLERATRNGEEIVLDMTKSELDGLATYDTSAYEAPPPGWLAPAAYGFPAGGYLWPVGAIEPMLQPAPKETVSRRTPDIRKGMKVRDADNNVIGAVEQVSLDSATGELRGIVVRTGGALEKMAGGGELREITAEHLEVIDDEVRLVSEAVETKGRRPA